MTTSVVVLMHNQLAYTRRCVETLLKTRGLDELIFVDNGSADKTIPFLEGVINGAPSHLRCELIANTFNAGGCKGRNQGAARARGDMLVFLDNDTYAPDPSWLTNLVADLRNQSQIGLVAPMMVFPPNGKVIQSAGGGMTSGGHFGLLGRGQSVSDPVHNRPRIVAWVPTACLLCRHQLFDEVGGFDESLDPISIGEDIDFCFRIREKDFKIWYDPCIRIQHYEGSTFNHSSFSYLKKETFIRNMRLLRNRWRRIIQTGPFSSEEDIRYIEIKKDYTNLSEPRIEISFDQLGSFADHRDCE